MFGKITKFHGSSLIEVEIITSELPATMPLVSDGIDNLGSGYTLAPGSTMIVTGTDKKYILGTDGTWEEVSSEGGGGTTTVIDTTCTLAAASWTSAAAPYTQTVNVTGVLTTDKPIIDVSVSDTVTTGISETEQWANITKATAGAGTITFSCYEEKPDIDLTVNVKVVR